MEMNFSNLKRKKSLIVISTTSIFLLTILLPLLFFNSKKERELPNEKTKQPTQIYDLELEKQYVSENKWNYKVTGKFPNPCYDAYIEVIIQESYPEQVTLLVEVIKPSQDMVCAQVITNFQKEGNFNASEQAVVELKIKKV